MPISRFASRCRGVALSALALSGCSADAEWEPELAETSQNLSVQARLTACAQDPRVLTNLVSKEICAGADIFFRETFNGNGRTCGSCHPAANNLTIDRTFINDLHATNPEDPLFIFENDPALAQLETNQLFNGGILENVDDFSDPTRKFVHRSVPHILSIATSLAPDTTDGTSIPPLERTGWSGDGAPGNGTLREFLTGAITQHYPKTLARVPGTDFRLPTSQELDLTLTFQRSVGRLNELDLTLVRLADAEAEEGRKAYIDPARGRCNFCHFNGGANSELTRKNANFDTGTRFRPVFGAEGTINGSVLFDGGFGGQGLTEPNILTFPIFEGDTAPNGLGDNTFNTPPVIEAADTLPGFHNDSATTPEGIVFFYVSSDFRRSKASADLIARFGTPIDFSGEDGNRIARFIRALNAVFNVDIAKQRLDAANVLVNRFRDTRSDIQKQLMRLAEEELNDALLDLNDPFGPPQPFYSVAQDRLNLAKIEIQAGLAATSWSTRQNRISNAISRVLNARDQFGSNMSFQLGKGNLMF